MFFFFLQHKNIDTIRNDDFVYLIWMYFNISYFNCFSCKNLFCIHSIYFLDYSKPTTYNAQQFAFFDFITRMVDLVKKTYMDRVSEDMRLIRNCANVHEINIVLNAIVMIDLASAEMNDNDFVHINCEHIIQIIKIAKSHDEKSNWVTGYDERLALDVLQLLHLLISVEQDSPYLSEYRASFALIKDIILK